MSGLWLEIAFGEESEPNALGAEQLVGSWC